MQRKIADRTSSWKNINILPAFQKCMNDCLCSHPIKHYLADKNKTVNAKTKMYSECKEVL